MTRKPGRITLLLADVDGTLVTHDKVLTPRACRAVADLKAAGIRFAITSGRPPRGMAMVIGPLAIETPVAGFNGGLFTHPDLSTIAERRVPTEVARETLALIAEHGCDPWLYAGNDWLVHKRDAPHVERESRTVQFEPTVVADFDDRLNEVVKVVGVSDDRSAIAACAAAVQDRFGKRVTAALSQPYYLDVTHPDANKGAVVDELARVLGLPVDEIATIGDMANDVSMFRRSGFAIAMGNADDAVKQEADAVTADCDHDGFALAVEGLLLGKDTRA